MNKNKRKKTNTEIMRATFIFVGLFLLVMGYFLYFQVFESSDVINNTYNKRQNSFMQKVVRGEILGSNGEVLAKTDVDEDGNETRVYPYGNVFSHIVGIPTHGKLGLELLFNFNLLTSNADTMEKIFNEFKGEKNIGDNIITTLDVNLQQVAYNALGSNRGAVVIMEPDTGKVLAMVSKPDFDPNQIDSNWDTLSADSSQSVLLNRATQGLYAPGSTFKIFTLLEYIRENSNYNDYSYICKGSYSIDSYSVKCFNGTKHGTENLLESFANSCNSSFVNIGLSLNVKSFAKNNNALLFNSSLPVSLPYSKSSFKLNQSSDTFSIMQTAIGQGETLVTPIHMALIASALANDGVLMTPYFVDHTENYTGKTVKKYKQSEYGAIFNTDETNILKEYLRAVVTQGTGKKLNSDVYTAYGKTGTAQIDSTDKNEHSWFVGFADNGQKKIAIAVVLESVPSGTDSAVNTTREIFNAYFK